MFCLNKNAFSKFGLFQQFNRNIIASDCKSLCNLINTVKRIVFTLRELFINRNSMLNFSFSFFLLIYRSIHLFASLQHLEESNESWHTECSSGDSRIFRLCSGVDVHSTCFRRLHTTCCSMFRSQTHKFQVCVCV